MLPGTIHVAQQASFDGQSGLFAQGEKDFDERAFFRLTDARSFVIFDRG